MSFISALRGIFNKVDVISPEQRRLRRQVKVERHGEIKENYRSVTDQLRALAIARDLQRNHTHVAGLLKQIDYQVVGTLPQMILSTDRPEWDRAAERWFNRTWAKRADDKYNRHLRDLNGLALRTVKRDGDVLMWFNRDTGRLRFFEYDQVAELTKDDFEKWQDEQGASDLIQERGTVVNSSGRVLGWFASSKYGERHLSLEDASFLSTTDATLLYDPSRYNMTRGQSELLSGAGLMQDLRECRQHTLTGYKLQATMPMVIKSKDSDIIPQVRRRDEYPNNNDNNHNNLEDGRPQNYDNLERISGGNIEYLDPEDTVENISVNALPDNYEAFYNHGIDAFAYSLGHSPMFAKATTKTSFSAARAEIIIDQNTNEIDRFWLLNYVMDWQIEKSLRWAMEEGQIEFRDDSDWVDRWEYDVKQEKSIDPNKTIKSNTEALQSGQMSYKDLLGADWERKLEEIGDGLERAKELGIVFPTNTELNEVDTDD